MGFDLLLNFIACLSFLLHLIQLTLQALQDQTFSGLKKKVIDGANQKIGMSIDIRAPILCETLGKELGLTNQF